MLTMPTVGENIRHYRQERGLNVSQLAKKVGTAESAIRHYEKNERTMSEEQLLKIACALDVSPLALRDYRIGSARDLMGLMLQLEETFGIVPDEDGKCLVLDHSAKNAQKLSQSIQGWADVRRQLGAGEMTQEEYEDWKAKF